MDTTITDTNANNINAAAADDDDDNDDDATRIIWQNLVAWIRQQGGAVHPLLALRPSSRNGGRGVFCTSRMIIRAGETLLRVPATAVLSGRHLPTEYQVVEQRDNGGEDDTKELSQRKASPWLRCLAANYQAQQQQQQLQSSPSSSTTDTTTTTRTTTTNFTPYLASLPTSYETVAAWSDDEVKSYLAGTCTQGGSAVAWHASDDELRQRYVRQVRPFLQSSCCDTILPMADTNITEDAVSDAELRAFQTSMACLSTRAFYLQKDAAIIANANNHETAGPKPSANDDDDDDDYTGPFLLPAIDLLNHAATDEPGHVTTLHRTADNAFECRAERDVMPNQEILHSYGDTLTSSQCLQTFGFVPASRMQFMANTTKETSSSTIQSTSLPPLSPALIQKQNVLETCWQVIESDIPTKLAARMQDMEDEVWTVKVDRTRTADFLSADLIVDGTAETLTDEIVTAAVVAFLPSCAYREAAQALIGAEILDDFFLGHLVCTSLLRVIQAKLETYTPITWQGQVYQDDAVLLRQCLRSSSNNQANVHQLRLQYGLTIRLEEKACLQALRKSVVEILAKLQASVSNGNDDAKDSNDDDDDDDDNMGQATKKQRIAE